MLKQLEKYYEQELHYAEIGMDNETDFKRRSDVAWYAAQRCLGAGQFAQMCGVVYEEVEPLFEATRLKLQEMVNREI